jgi:hypothetical protein
MTGEMADVILKADRFQSVSDDLTVLKVGPVQLRRFGSGRADAIPSRRVGAGRQPWVVPP